jgi:hypothetical protein
MKHLCLTALAAILAIAPAALMTGVTAASAGSPGGTINAGSPLLVSAVLPGGRSVEVGSTATAFATIINAGTAAGTGCGLALGSAIAAKFSYQTTDPTTNAPVGTANTPVTIAAGGDQTYVFAIEPTAALAPEQLIITASCANAQPAPVTAGVNTFLLSASTTPVPDIVALAATASNNGLVEIPTDAAGAFAVATDNLGSSDTLTFTADTGAVSLPLALSLCETNPGTGQCLAPPSSSVSVAVGTNATPTFSIFATADGTIPFSPGVNRMFFTSTDQGGVVRGETSVAVQSP